MNPVRFAETHVLPSPFPLVFPCNSRSSTSTRFSSSPLPLGERVRVRGAGPFVGHSAQCDGGSFSGGGLVHRSGLTQADVKEPWRLYPFCRDVSSQIIDYRYSTQKCPGQRLNVRLPVSRGPSRSTALEAAFLAELFTICPPTSSMRTQYIRKPATTVSYKNGILASSWAAEESLDGWRSFALTSCSR